MSHSGCRRRHARGRRRPGLLDRQPGCLSSKAVPLGFRASDELAFVTRRRPLRATGVEEFTLQPSVRQFNPSKAKPSQVKPIQGLCRFCIYVPRDVSILLSRYSRFDVSFSLDWYQDPWYVRCVEKNFPVVSPKMFTVFGAVGRVEFSNVSGRDANPFSLPHGAPNAGPSSAHTSPKRAHAFPAPLVLHPPAEIPAARAPEARHQHARMTSALSTPNSMPSYSRHRAPHICYHTRTTAMRVHDGCDGLPRSPLVSAPPFLHSLIAPPPPPLSQN